MRLAGVLCQAAAVAASIVQEHQQGAFTLDMYSEQVSRTGRLATLPPPRPHPTHAFTLSVYKACHPSHTHTPPPHTHPSRLLRGVSGQGRGSRAQQGSSAGTSWCQQSLFVCVCVAAADAATSCGLLSDESHLSLRLST